MQPWKSIKENVTPILVAIVGAFLIYTHFYPPSVESDTAAHPTKSNAADVKLGRAYGRALVQAAADTLEASASRPWTSTSQAAQQNLDDFDDRLSKAWKPVASELTRRFGPTSDQPVDAAHGAEIRQFCRDVATGIQQEGQAMTRKFVPGWDPGTAQRTRAAFLSRGQQFVTAHFDDDRPLPSAFSLARFRLWPFDQGPVGSCFANGTAQAFQIHTAADVADGARWELVPLSRRLVWYQGRKLDGSLGGRGDGGSVTNAMAAMGEPPNGVGVCHEDMWPYKPEHRWLEQKPTPDVFADANLNRISQIAEVAFGEPWKRAIFNGHPVAIGIWWPYGWDSSVGADGRATGIGRGTYGHALAVIGWIDDWEGHRHWQIENSHGPIYHPVPSAIASQITGYQPAQPDKTFDFWVRDEWLQEVLGYGQSESLAAAGLTGFKKRILDWEEMM